MVDLEPKKFVIQGDVYEVEKLVAVKIVKGQKLYRVRWRGYGRESDTMEPEENLLSCKDMIQDLEEKIKERHERRRNKKPFKTFPLYHKELRSSTLLCEAPKPPPTDATWQATEVQPGPLSKDTFWRDFDEGKISVSNTVYDKDMYSKVKERAERTGRIPGSSEGGKNSEPGMKDVPSPPLCPKVVLKRKPVIRTSECLGTYKSAFKVKPIGLQIRKRKKYDVLRDYRRRKSRVHRKKNLDENGQRKLVFRGKGEIMCLETAQGSSKILQELLINDELKKSMLSEYSSADSVMSKPMDSKMKPPKASTSEDVMKSHLLACRISIQEAVGIKKETERSQSSKGSSISNSTIRKAFASLMEAVMSDKPDTVERLCKNYPIVNCCREDGITALMLSSQLGRLHVALSLLKANAHKDKQNANGETALMMACKSGYSIIAKILLEHGANFAITNNEGINVLRIINQYNIQPDIHSILIEHIVRVVSQFESGARSQVRHIAQIKYALFPIQCFSLNEGPRYYIDFHHHDKLESPEKNGNQNLLFIARATINSTTAQCQFDTDSILHSVNINGVRQDLFENIKSVFKVTGLQNGSNKVSITTTHSPESQMKLIVCAYKVHRTFYFPTQKLKSEH